EGRIVTQAQALRLWFLLALFPAGLVVRAQSVTSLRPPNQPYIYDLAGTLGPTVPAVAALNLGASFSIEFWMMLDPDGVDAQYMRIFSRAGAYELGLQPGTHQLTYSQSSHFATLAGSLQPGLWYHVAIISNNLEVTLYLNGEQQARFTVPTPPPANSLPFVFNGQTFGDGSSLCCGFPGSLRQFRIWARALQPSEISAVAAKLLSGT